ncbi:MAG TPA: ABC transporter permease [Candidatus Binataceae bacterium]|nr:ABC transporter permease [Candidatus Binataceae bacterium]
MKLNRIQGVVMRHTYEARRNFDRLTDLVYWPVLDIIVWGFFTIYIRQDGKPGTGIASFLLAAVIMWGMFYAFQRDMAVGFLDELWARNLINLFSTPLTVGEYMAGLLFVNFIKAGISLLAAAIVAWIAYSFDIFPILPSFVPYMACLILFAFALGIAITGIIFRYTTKVQGLAWSSAALLLPLSCVFYPVKALPKSLQPIAWMLPTTHAFEGMRQTLAGGGFSPMHFWWAMGLNVAYFALAVVFFRSIFESARSRGLLVKLE